MSACLGEEVRVDRFMAELDNGVRLCRLVGILQNKIPQDSEKTQVRETCETVNISTRLFLCLNRFCLSFITSFPPRKFSSRRTPPLDRFSLATTLQTFFPGVVILEWMRRTCSSLRVWVRTFLAILNVMLVFIVLTTHD